MARHRSVASEPVLQRLAPHRAVLVARCQRGERHTQITWGNNVHLAAKTAGRSSVISNRDYGVNGGGSRSACSGQRLVQAVPSPKARIRHMAHLTLLSLAWCVGLVALEITVDDIDVHMALLAQPLADCLCHRNRAVVSTRAADTDGNEVLALVAVAPKGAGE